MKTYEVPFLRHPITQSLLIPGSKSITNRALLLAALAHGKSVLHDVLKSDDTRYMQVALGELGVTVEETGADFLVYGTGGSFYAGEKELFLGNAGTATRFLTAAMMLRNDWTTIDGNERMRQRPIQDLIDGMLALQVDVESSTGCPPVRVRGNHNMKNELTMSGANSSQYFSAMMQTAPCLPQGLTIHVDGDLVSKPYIDITIDVMNAFGVEVFNSAYKLFSIPHQNYQAREYFIEGDASASSYWFALAAITRSTITVQNISYRSPQGDVHFVDVLEKMGCMVEKHQRGITVTGPKKLKALGEVNMNAMPDVAMTLAIVAVCAEGETIITDVANMRIKETDRIKALVTEMKKMGIDCEELPEGLIVRGSPNRHGASIDTYDDHRMAMCFGILGTVTPGVIINDPDCCSKTYPNFFEELSRITR